MSASTELLDYIYKNAGMGVESIGKLLEETENDDFKSFLSEQYADYKNICNSCEDVAKDKSHTLKDLGTFSKLETDMMIELKTLGDKTPDSMTGMLMQGSIMGIVQSIRRIKQYESDCDSEVKNIAQKLLKIEERNIQECPKWLGVQ